MSGLNAAGGGGAGRDELEGAERERPPRHRRVRLGGVRGKNVVKGILSRESMLAQSLDFPLKQCSGSMTEEFSCLLHHFSKIKSQKEVTKYKDWLIIEGSGSVPLTKRSGSGSRRPKNIRIRSTALSVHA
jgi:hypothetical protein